jgi:hypothetical protein
MENYVERMRQARIYLMQHPNIIPLDHVREIALYGGVDRWVVAGGININTPEGSRLLDWEVALHDVCRDLCDMGAGNRPYMPVPYLNDPVIVAEEGEQGEGLQPQPPPVYEPAPAEPVPAEPAHVEPAPAEPDNPAVRIVRVAGNLFPPPPPLFPAPAAPRPQPPHRDPPLLKAKPEVKVEVKTEPNPGPGEYVEPTDDEYGGFM